MKLIWFLLPKHYLVITILPIVMLCTTGERNNPFDSGGIDYRGVQIISSPQNKTITEGDAVSISVSAEGSNLSYQWQKNGVNISGANSSIYSIDQTNDSNKGNYRCIVWNTWERDTSNSAVLTVNPNIIAPQITNQPANLKINAGQNATISVSATGTDLQYQWLKNDTIISGATSWKYSIASVNMSHCGKYSCIVSNSKSTINSSEAILSVHANHTQMVFSDNFIDSSNSNDWAIRDLSFIKIWIGGGYYYMDHDSVGRIYHSSKQISAIENSDNFSIEISAEHISSSDGDAFGLIFYASSDDFYRFAISDDGYYTIYNNNSGQWSALVSWKSEASIMSSSYNILKITKNGNYSYFYINETWVKTVYIPTIYGNRFGFTVSQTMTVRFDYIKISR